MKCLDFKFTVVYYDFLTVLPVIATAPSVVLILPTSVLIAWPGLHVHCVTSQPITSSILPIDF